MNATQLITNPEYHDEVEWLSGDRLRVGILDPLKGITPEAYEWWFGNMERETYMQWHPGDHKEFAWVRGWEPGRYVGATHMTHQTLGGTGPLMRAEITFLPPSELLDESLFVSHDVGVAICAAVHMLDESDRPREQEAGRFIHLGLRRDYGTELRSSFWLNVAENADVDRMTVGRTKHVHEECRNLMAFLPDLYVENG